MPEVLSFAPGVFKSPRSPPGRSLQVGGIFGLTARPLLESLMQLANNLPQDAIAILRSWISRRWD